MYVTASGNPTNPKLQPQSQLPLFPPPLGRDRAAATGDGGLWDLYIVSSGLSLQWSSRNGSDSSSVRLVEEAGLHWLPEATFHLAAPLRAKLAICELLGNLPRDFEVNLVLANWTVLPVGPALQVDVEEEAHPPLAEDAPEDALGIEVRFGTWEYRSQSSETWGNRIAATVSCEGDVRRRPHL